MKVLKYRLMTQVNHGTEEQPDMQPVFSHVTLGWSEANEEIAKAEAYNGEYTVIEDGQEQSDAVPSLYERVAALETESTEMKEALDLILSGVTE